MHVAIRVRGSLPSVAETLRLLDAVAQRMQAVLQVVDADAVYNERHIASAAQHAERATAQGRATAHGLGAEFLLYLTGERQVRRALEVAGVHDGASELVLVALGPTASKAVAAAAKELGWAAKDGPWPPNAKALERLGARDELDVLQKVALVDLLK